MTTMQAMGFRMRRAPSAAGSVWMSERDQPGAALVLRYRPWAPRREQWLAELFLDQELERRVVTGYGETRQDAERDLANRLAAAMVAAGGASEPEAA